MHIAIIGGGAAGMATAYLLNNHHHVTVIEKQPILGGNIRTLNKNVTDADFASPIFIDNGVIEFQQDHFVQFHKLMDKLGVEMARSSRWINRPIFVRWPLHSWPWHHPR